MTSKKPNGPSLVDRLADDARNRLPGQAGVCAANLFKLLHARTPLQVLERHEPAALVATSLGLLEFIARPFDGFRVRVTAGPDGHTVLETAGPDQPFIVDSLLELLRVREHSTREFWHPIVAVERSPTGELTAIGPPCPGCELVSVTHFEFEEKLDEAARERLRRETVNVLAEARLVVADFQPMLQRVQGIEAELKRHLQPKTATPRREEIEEALTFLEWLRRRNFVFLGCRGYDLRGTGNEATIEVEHHSGLGILRDESGSTFATPKPLISLPREQTERIVSDRLVLVHKANSESRVLRRKRLDYIGIKKLDAHGKVAGEHRILGLFTSRAYNDLPSDIPILRRKLQEVYTRSDVVPGSHEHREIFSIFTSIPKHELFLLESEQIAEMIRSIMDSASRRDVRVSYRPDFLERGVSVMVLLPKEKFNAEARVAVQKLLADEIGGTLVDYRLELGEEPMARLHFYFAVKQGMPTGLSRDALEEKVAEIVRTWQERLAEALERELGASKGHHASEQYAKAFPVAYVASKSPETAVSDIRHVDDTLRTGKIQVALASVKQPQGRKVTLLKIYRAREPFALSALMPVLTNLGLHVLDEQSFRIAPGNNEVHVHSFRVQGPDGGNLATGKTSRNLEEIVPAVIAGEVENDTLNTLVARAGLNQYQVTVLRAFDAYLRQLGGPWSRRTTHAALVDNSDCATALVSYFEARFDPSISSSDRPAREQKARDVFATALASVKGIVEDQVLQACAGLIGAAVRTNAYQRGTDGQRRPALAVKFRCADVPVMPEPRPLYEIFVHSAAVDGVHLRTGKVARGGIRWSSRPDDYRMEILGLMKAQRTKNAVIVPVGAKGGFILKRATSPTPPAAEIKQHYEVFIGALLDVTDNLDGSTVIHPRDVVRHDEDDPYLVVAADRGTAALSDTANSIATARGFWLGDAFASGGSRGYNHKQEAITARGAWECIRRHFRELGVDIDRETFTVAGIGDMSGDVFGNGMLYTPNLRLVAAFNHAHIFIDPSPAGETSHRERRRLFDKPGSQWTDYDVKLLSPGGGIYRRDAKSIALSPEARAALGVVEEDLNGDELVKAILKMPVDLLFNGGIGTYIKARTETHVDVSDPANNAVRIDGAELRARVVAEGGNLGCTQLGRIEYARCGGRINTDFIDNSAGVDLSDHEVNLKILLAGATGRGALKESERDDVLRAATSGVCSQVLRDNYLQGQVLSREELRALTGLEEHRFLIVELASSGLLNRSVEHLPSDEELLRLRDGRLGLTRPRLAVLLAYAKIDAYTKVLASSLPDESRLKDLVTDYFPPAVSRRFSADVAEHRLRREIAATVAVNQAINAMGIAFFHETARRTGGTFDVVYRGWQGACDLCGWRDFEVAMDKVYADGCKDMPAFYAAQGRFQAAIALVIQILIRRDLATPAADRELADLQRQILRIRKARIVTPTTTASGMPAAIAAMLLAAERVSEEIDIAALLAPAGAGVEVTAARAAQVWQEASDALLLEQVMAASGQVARLTGEDFQACASLVEQAKEHRQALARALLGGHSLHASALRERDRAAKLLGRARSSEPLTLAGLYVVVEALGRSVRSVHGQESQ